VAHGHTRVFVLSRVPTPRRHSDRRPRRMKQRAVKKKQTRKVKAAKKRQREAARAAKEARDPTTANGGAPRDGDGDVAMAAADATLAAAREDVKLAEKEASTSGGGGRAAHALKVQARRALKHKIAGLRRVLLTLVPVRPRRRGARRSLRTLSPGARISPPAPRFRSRRASTPFNSASDAFELHPDIRSYGRRPSGRSARRSPSATSSSSRRGRRSERRYRRSCARGKPGAFYTLVPIRPRSRGERRFLRTFAVVSLRSPLAFNPRPRRL
jgi:hypothetical protein